MNIHFNIQTRLYLSMLAGFALAISLRAEETLMLRQGSDGYTECDDTYIFKTDPDQNFNQGRFIPYLSLRKVGSDLRLGLVRWNPPADLLKNRVLVSAKMVLFVQASADDPQGSHRDHQRVGLFPLKRAWEALEVNWKQASSLMKWDQEGAQGMEDIDSTAVAEAEAQSEDGCRLEFSLPLDLVKKWVTDPESNHGLLVRFTDERPDLALEFYSSETPAMRQEMRPTLELTLK